MSEVKEACVPSMVAHQMLPREQSGGREEMIPSMVSHRLSTYLDQENEDTRDDLVKTCEFADITKKIEKLSKDVVEDSELLDKVNKATMNPSNMGYNNASAYLKQAIISEDPEHKELLPSTISQQVSTEESSYGLEISHAHQTVEDEDTLDNEDKSSSYEQDDQDEDEGDFDDSNAIVYSCTLGNNQPVLIQTVGTDIMDEDDEDDEDDFAGKPVESKIVISCDGKISEISIERPSTTDEDTTKRLQETVDYDKVSLSDKYINKPLIKDSDRCCKKVEELTNNQKEQLDNHISEEKKSILLENKEQQCAVEKNKVVHCHNTSAGEENPSERNLSVSQDPRSNLSVSQDSNLSVSQDPRRKGKFLDLLLGCFRCNKKQPQ